MTDYEPASDSPGVDIIQGPFPKPLSDVFPASGGMLNASTWFWNSVESVQEELSRLLKKHLMEHWVNDWFDRIDSAIASTDITDGDDVDGFISQWESHTEIDDPYYLIEKNFLNDYGLDGCEKSFRAAMRNTVFLQSEPSEKTVVDAVFINVDNGIEQLDKCVDHPDKVHDEWIEVFTDLGFVYALIKIYILLRAGESCAIVPV
jgi:hypothetical protein